MKIEWKTVEERTAYEVSNFGSVRRGGRLLKLSKYKLGYMYVNTSEYSFTRKLLVHRMVAKAFVPGMTEERYQVNHKNGVKDNNIFTNLEWVTPKENTQHSWLSGLQPSRNGENNPSCKLSDEQVKDIRKRYAAGGISQLALGVEYSVSHTHISKIVRGESRVTPT